MHLETTGSFPKQFPDIRDRQLALQDSDGECDHIFEIPIELFVSLGGIRYDADIPGADDDPWQILDRVKQKKSWWPFSRTK